MEQRTKFIKADRETVKFICQTVKGRYKKTFVTDRTVYLALEFKSNSQTAERIRQIALSRGAQLWENTTHQLGINN